jgi:hypothetical protein
VTKCRIAKHRFINSCHPFLVVSSILESTICQPGALLNSGDRGTTLKEDFILPVTLLPMLEANREPCDGVEQNRGENLDVSYK